MNVPAYLKSLGDEMLSLKDRVRHIIDDHHWQTDGEWKESVVRQMLRRSLAPSAIVSRGFVVSANEVSSQIDIIVHRAESPVIYRDGELVFLTPDAVLALIEVKSKVSKGDFVAAAAKLATNIALVRKSPNFRALSGLIAFDVNGAVSRDWIAEATSCMPDSNSALTIASLGNDHFFRFWELTPESPHHTYSSWHGYALPYRSFGYFLHNVIEASNPESVARNSSIWYPDRGKEGHRFCVVPASWANQSDVVASQRVVHAETWSRLERSS
jgi:hypothetical protein